MESFRSVLPITAVVFLISITIAPLETGSLTMFLCGAVMLILGMGLFQLGVDMAMMPMGEGMGVGITKSKKLWLVAVLCFAIGAVVTIAEPGSYGIGQPGALHSQSRVDPHGGCGRGAIFGGGAAAHPFPDQAVAHAVGFVYSGVRDGHLCAQRIIAVAFDPAA